MYPALTVADALRIPAALRNQENRAADRADGTYLTEDDRQAVPFLYLGRAGGIEERLAQRAQIPFQAIQVGGIHGLAPWTAARNFWRLIQTTARVRAILRTFKPDAVFATGGYVSAPTIWASALEHIPSVIYLPDLEPGWAVRATARWATRVAVSFPEVTRHFEKNQAVVTGYPVRAEFFRTDRARARRMFHLDPDASTVTIFGGSTGAHHINQAALACLADLSNIAQVILLTGRADEEWANAQVQSLSADLCARMRVYGYLDEQLPHALAAANVVVARAGAATLGEFPALGLPAILVPYPYAGKHQERNAQFLVERGAAVKVDDAALPDELVPTLKRLFETPDQLNKMSRAAHALAQPRAAENIANLLRDLSEGHR